MTFRFNWFFSLIAKGRTLTRRRRCDHSRLTELRASL